MNNTAAQIIVNQMKNSPDLMELLINEAIKFLADKHTVLASDIEQAYVANTADVVDQVQELVIRGWVTAHTRQNA